MINFSATCFLCTCQSLSIFFASLYHLNSLSVFFSACSEHHKLWKTTELREKMIVAFNISRTTTIVFRNEESRSFCLSIFHSKCRISLVPLNLFKNCYLHSHEVMRRSKCMCIVNLLLILIHIFITRDDVDISRCVLIHRLICKIFKNK